MLWEYVYIGSEMVRNSMIGLCLMVSLCLASSKKKSRGKTNSRVAEPVREVRKNRQTKTGLPQKKDKHKPSTVLEEAKGLGVLLALEPRIMFDGAALVTGAEVVQEQVNQDLATQDQDLQGIDDDSFTNSSDLLSALSSVTAPSDRKEIVFIDTSVEDYQTLLDGIDPNAEAVLLDSTRDGMEQIAEILRERSDIDAIHIISHGNQGELRFGTGALNLASMQGEYADELAIINEALTEEADFLIYGCNFGEGESGKEAATLLAQLTGTDVAASVDDTGSAQYDADWDLEYQTGIIETQVAVSAEAQENWVGKLAIITVDTFADVVNGSDGVTSLREAIIAVNAGPGGDTINLAAGTYTLSIAGTGENAAASGDLDILQNVTIVGAGAGATIIDGNATDRVFHVISSTSTISGVTIQNGSEGTGGGIWIDSSSSLTLQDTAVTGNVSTTTGGGILVSGTAILDRVTLEGNTADVGGGLYIGNGASATLTNTTLSGNTATSNGGAINVRGTTDITNSTIASNSSASAGGIRTQGPGSASLKNTILANNTGGNANGSFTSLGNNIDSDSTAGLGDPLDGVDPMLAALADNGGPTRTHALLGGSPAINAGTAVGAPAVDQRGVTRDGSVDIGAYEVTVGNTAPTADAGGPYSINEGENLTLNASGSSDPDFDLLTYKWDLDNDSIFGEAGEPTTVGPTVSWATLQSFGIDDDGVYTIGVEAEDGNGGSDTATTTLTVNNVAPTLTTTGAGTIANGSSYTLNLSASDPGDDTISGWTINWGDGTIDTVAGNPPSVTHTYTNSGLTFNILASATDEDGTFLQNELLVPRYVVDSVFRFEETTGAFLQQFAPQSGGLDDPIQTIIGPDGNLYVTGERSDNVVRYNPTTGAKIDDFVTSNSGGLNSPGGLTFGPDGNLYVGSYGTHEVLRFDGTTGAFIDTFATGVTRAYGVEFGPDGNLYVSSFTGNTVLKFDGTTGASLGTFVTANAGGLSTPERMTFGPDGHLYIASSGSDEVLRYNGTTGAFIDDFVTAGLGGLNSPGGIDFGPDGNLYVSGQISDNILRYDGTSGAFLGEYVSAATGLDRPAIFTFLPGHQVMVTNAPPTLDLDANDSSGATSNDYQFTFTEGDAPTAIADSDTDLVDVDSTTFASVQLAVSGLLDGNAETLVLNGSTFTLATAVAGQDTTGGNYRVVIATGAGTATVTITKQGGGTFTEIETETLITAIQYQHTDTSAPTDGDRLIDVIVNDGIADSAAARTTINVNPTNDPPVITSDGGGATAMVNSPENQTSVTTVTVTDVDLPADTLTFSKIGGADAALFNLDSGTGALTFSGARDFETFTDANSDGVYEVTVQVDDGNGGMDTQAISVTVTDVLEGNTLVVDTTSDYGIADPRYGNTSSIGALLADKGTDNFISLREAIDAANNTANGGAPDEIQFNIADNDLGHLYYQNDFTPGSLSLVTTTTFSDAMIGDFDPDYPYAQHSWFRIDLSNLLPQLEITDAVNINGYTQPGATQNSLSIGDNAELRIELTSSGADGNRGLTIQPGGTGSSILGLVINGFDLSGILTEPGADNVTVQGNFIGTDVTGTLDLGNGDDGVQLRSSDNQVGGSNVVDRNVLSGNNSRGISTFTFGPIETGNVIQNNYIGVDATGVGNLGNAGNSGVQINKNDGLQLLDNVIADNANYGIRILNAASIFNPVIQGNLIGVGADGTTALGNGSHGIWVDDGGLSTTIGGILASQGNTIANNTGDGISITNGTRVTIRGNRIFNNGGLGIDLVGSNGVNNNDTGDGDGGPNNLQNFPVLTTAAVNGTDLIVNGTLNSAPGTTFNIDFYASTTADASGHGEAERYLGSANVTTDGSGNTTISQLLSSVGVVAGEFVTATATDSNGNTSEFSLNATAANNTAPTLDLDADDNSGATGNDYTITFTEGDGPTVIADSDTDLVDLDSLTFAHVTLSIGGLLDGNAETLILDGDTFALANAVAGQDTSGGTYRVVITTGAGTATMTITKQGGGTFTEIETETLITAVQYQHTDTLTPTDGDRLIDVTVNDGTVDSAAARTTINVNPSNTPPVAVADGFTVIEGSTNTLNLAGNDTDADDGLDLTSIAIISSPTNGTITSINANGTVEYTHNGSETLADSFTYTINDLSGATSNTVTVSLTITPQNDAPIITSDGGGANASVSILSGNTAVTDVNATDVEGTPLTYSIIGGADAALFSVASNTGILTFNNAPNFQAPGDVGGDNIYDVIVQVSDGTATDTQSIAVTVTDVPVVVLPPPPDPSPDSPTDNGEEDTGESEEETIGGGVGITFNSQGSFSSSSQGSTAEDPNDSNLMDHLKANEVATAQQVRESKLVGGTVNNLLDLLKQGFDSTTFKSEIQSLLTTSGFLRDLDQVRNAFQEATANEKTYVASSIAASTGLSIGYVFWLLRSGVLLTALLSSVPAWQFVNPLLVLDTPTKNKRKKGQDDADDDSVESMFENHTVPTETSERKPGRQHKSH